MTSLFSQYAHNRLDAVKRDLLRIDKAILTRSMYGASPDQLQELKRQQSFYQLVIKQQEREN